MKVKKLIPLAAQVRAQLRESGLVEKYSQAGPDAWSMWLIIGLGESAQQLYNEGLTEYTQAAIANRLAQVVGLALARWGLYEPGFDNHDVKEVEVALAEFKKAKDHGLWRDLRVLVHLASNPTSWSSLRSLIALSILVSEDRLGHPFEPLLEQAIETAYQNGSQPIL